MRKRIYVGITSSLLVFFSATQAEVSLDDFKFNGFLSVGAGKSTVRYLPGGVQPIYDSHIDKRWSFSEDTDFGLQVSKALSENLSVQAEFLSLAAEDFNVDVSWANLKYTPTKRMRYRLGRIRTEPYLLSVTEEIPYTYPWIRTPQEVYSQAPLRYSNFDGGDAQYRFSLWHRDFYISAFYGARNSSANVPSGPNTTVVDDVLLRFRNVWSFNFSYGDDLFTIRGAYQTAQVTAVPNAGIFAQNLNAFLNTNDFGSAYTDYFTVYNRSISSLDIGYRFEWNNVVSMGELAKRQSATPMVASVLGWYLMGGYRVNKVLPHITFSREKILDTQTRQFNGTINSAALTAFGVTLDSIAQNLTNTSPYYAGGAGAQTSVTLGVRWDVYKDIAVKAEYQHIHPDDGSAGLFNINPQKSVNLYSVALNAVF